MIESEKNPTQMNTPPDPQAEKKKKLWKNLFLLNLSISVVLIGIFWLPLKLVQLEDFLDSPSVNLPQKGKVAQSSALDPVAEIDYKNMLTPRTTVINASSEKDWIYFDFSRGSTVKIHDPSSLEWDLAFRRGKVISNGGATNKFGKAGLIDLRVTDFDTVTEVPADKYTQDVATRTETENPVLLKWYKYNYLTHKLNPKRNIYALRTSDNKFAKVQFLSFYCDNKETGCISMRYTYQNNGANNFFKNQQAGVTSIATHSAAQKS